MKKMMDFIGRATVFVGVASIVVACGGGGGSSSTSNITQSSFSVQMAAPADGGTGVSLDASVQLAFNEDVFLPSVILQAADGTCSGSVQISADEFVSCLGGVVNASTNSIFDITGLTLASSTTYKVKVTTDVTNLSGTPLSSEYVTASGFTMRYRHTIAIDGVNEFTANEVFASTTPGYGGYFAWDDTYLYLGMNGTDIASGSSDKYVVFYLSGASGTTTGFTLNSQTPTLPFNAAYVLTYRMDSASTKLYSWSGSSWVDTGFDPTGSASLSGSFIELRLPFASLGIPSSMSVHLNIVDVTAAAEWTYAGIPSTSFADGYNPAYSKYFNFDFTASSQPNSYTVLP